MYIIRKQGDLEKNNSAYLLSGNVEFTCCGSSITYRHNH